MQLGWELLVQGGSRKEPSLRRQEPGRTLRHFVGFGTLPPPGDPGRLPGLELKSLSLGVQHLLHLGLLQTPILSSAVCPHVFIDSFSHNFPQKLVVKLHSPLLINWSCCVDCPSHKGLISCHISLEIHL